MKPPFTRRSFLRGLAATAVGAPLLSSTWATRARAQSAGGVVSPAKRAIFFYFPDGVPGPSSNGDPSAFHASGGEFDFTTPPLLDPLVPFRDRCLFFRGLSMGPTDNGSHPGGAKKLLTASDGGNGWSIDTYLSRNSGASAPFHHLYLGAMADVSGASGDKHITYVDPGVTTSPEDDPAQSFARVFAGLTTPSTPSAPAGPGLEQSILDDALEEIGAYQARLGTVEQQKLALHLDALREVEQRVAALQQTAGQGAGAAWACAAPSPSQVPSTSLYDPSQFPAILRAQTDVMVAAMACGLTKVGTIQCSVHTSELLMSAFPDTEMFNPSFDMRSHQASHYGPSHDVSRREYAQYVVQRKWFVAQLAYLLGELAARPEGDGTMLDHSLVLLCSEICDGNTHSHDDMPFILAGGGGGIRTGRLLDVGYRRHGSLLAAIGCAMGEALTSYGDGSGVLDLT